MTARAALLALAASAVLAAAAAADALPSTPPVGALPAGRVFRVKVLRDATFVIRAPRRPANSGLVWRIVRPLDARMVRQVAEGEDRLNVWLRFRAQGTGTTRIVLALTKGETRTAHATRTWIVGVREPGTA